MWQESNLAAPTRHMSILHRHPWAKSPSSCMFVHHRRQWAKSLPSCMLIKHRCLPAHVIWKFTFVDRSAKRLWQLESESAHKWNLRLRCPILSSLPVNQFLFICRPPPSWAAPLPVAAKVRRPSGCNELWKRVDAHFNFKWKWAVKSCQARSIRSVLKKNNRVWDWPE